MKLVQEYSDQSLGLYIDKRTHPNDQIKTLNSVFHLYGLMGHIQRETSSSSLYRGASTMIKLRFTIRHIFLQAKICSNTLLLKSVSSQSQINKLHCSENLLIPTMLIWIYGAWQR
jgi:hypothetical protein